jgi:hypothetical protein
MSTNVILKGLVILLATSLGQGPVLAENDEPGKAAEVNKEEAAGQVKDQGRQKNRNAAAGKSATRAPVYVPPMRGAPVARVGGGTRGVGDGLPYVSVVTPEQTGYTSSSQPVLYWYLSEAVDTRFEFALINDDEIEPILEIANERQMKKGLNFLDMAEHGVSLIPGVIYQWSVALVGQQEKRSSDIVSGGTIELVEMNKDQRAALAQADSADSVVIYAREGYWYDAFAGLSRLIDADPGNQELVAQRTDLLRQVGLDEVADAGK